MNSFFSHLFGENSFLPMLLGKQKHKRHGHYTKGKVIRKSKRKHLQQIQKMSRVKNRCQ